MGNRGMYAEIPKANGKNYAPGVRGDGGGGGGGHDGRLYKLQA